MKTLVIICRCLAILLIVCCAIVFGITVGIANTTHDDLDWSRAAAVGIGWAFIAYVIAIMTAFVSKP